MEEFQAHYCGNCDQGSICGNIYVALRILEVEMRGCHDPSLLSRFQKLNEEIGQEGYHYPDGYRGCGLVNNSGKAEVYRNRLQSLLADLRRQAAHR